MIPATGNSYRVVYRSTSKGDAITGPGGTIRTNPATYELCVGVARRHNERSHEELAYVEYVENAPVSVEKH